MKRIHIHQARHTYARMAAKETGSVRHQLDQLYEEGREPTIRLIESLLDCIECPQLAGQLNNSPRNQSLHFEIVG